LAPKDLCTFCRRPVIFVISANEFLFLDQALNDLPVEPSELFRMAFAEKLKPAMPTPEISHSIPSIALGFAFHFRRDVALSLP